MERHSRWMAWFVPLCSGLNSPAWGFPMDLTRVLESPHALHAATAHLPISLGILGFPLILLAVRESRRWPNVRLHAGVFFFFTSVIALAAVLAGDRAAAELVALANDKIEAVVAQHRQLGFSVAALALVTSILVTASHFGGRFLGRLLAGLAVVNALGLAGMVLLAGSSGGRLVYGFGIGTPVVGADGRSGATPVVGAYQSGASAAIPFATSVRVEPVDATYTPTIQSIDPAQAALVQFQSDVAPILERHCYTCHSGENPKAGLDLATQDAILKGGDYAGPAALPGAPDQSPMVLHIRGIYEPKMPKDADELTEDELHTIRMWIASGARGE